MARAMTSRGRNSINRHTTEPRPVPKSRRNHPVQHLSSFKPGVAHPVKFIPMHREDRADGVLDCTIEMMEVKELIANGVAFRFSAYVVPWLAMERFEGSRDQFDRSWMKKSKTRTDPTVVPFITKQVYGAPSAVPIFKAAGVHFGPTQAINTMYVEAYNQVYNWRARNRSEKLTPRLLTDTSLAPAFWHHTGFEHIVTDFDQAKLHGEVALEIVEAKLPVKGIGFGAAALASNGAYGSIKQSGETAGKPLASGITVNANGTNIVIGTTSTATTAFPDVYAQMGGSSIKASLANFKKATLLQEWAEKREQYRGHREADGSVDDKMIGMLMAGLTIEDQWLKDPIWLDEEVIYFKMGKRYSSTAGQLDDSAVSGVVNAKLHLHCPKLAVGGVIVVLAEVLPDQLFERRLDPFLVIDDADDLPNAELDQADTEKVDIVLNKMIDVGHSAPDDLFGYEPMNARWNQAGPTIGGDFLRLAATTGNTEARQRIWAVEAVDPALTDDFYIAKDGIHTKPFLDEVLDPFQIQVRGNVVLGGLTQFGGVLVEATDNYDKLVEETADDKIEKA